MGTLASTKIPVGAFDRLGGTTSVTVPVPVALAQGVDRHLHRGRAVLRLQWFDNQTEPLPNPTFSICGVVRDEVVAILTNGNLPCTICDFVVMVNGMARWA